MIRTTIKHMAYTHPLACTRLLHHNEQASSPDGDGVYHRGCALFTLSIISQLCLPTWNIWFPTSDLYCMYHSWRTSPTCVVLINWCALRIKKMWELGVACFLLSPILGHWRAPLLAPAQPPNLKTEPVLVYNMMITNGPILAMASRCTWSCSNGHYCLQYGSNKEREDVPRNTNTRTMNIAQWEWAQTDSTINTKSAHSQLSEVI